ncbi:FadR/GntR family transcriptional regulator [Sporichthya brevicatena]|uniref:FadR/GntR family transcriptional regulator n=1 Tax=Sporichthya brevicatena TaxID=171442 RepID=A0ABP3S5W0_9ACTN
MATEERLAGTPTDQAFSVMAVQRPRQQVETQIREAIRSGVLGPGHKLPSEMALAQDFGVSRTTVREALRTLVADGLVQKVPGAGGGSFVRSLNHESFSEELGQDLENLLRVGSFGYQEASQVRRFLEVPAARLAAQNRTEEHLVTLRQIIAEEKSISHDDPAVPDLDVRFHSAISEASGNRVVAAFVSALHQVAQPVDHLHLDAEVGRRTVRQHVAIVRAIENGDPKAAEQAMLTHLDYLEKHQIL